MSEAAREIGEEVIHVTVVCEKYDFSDHVGVEEYKRNPWCSKCGGKLETCAWYGNPCERCDDEKELEEARREGKVKLQARYPFAVVRETKVIEPSEGSRETSDD